MFEVLSSVERFRVVCGDNLDALRTMPDCSVDSVVTDPPYGLGQEPDALAMLADWLRDGHHDVKIRGGFMGAKWDSFVPQPVLWRECLRVLKPGGHLLCFSGARTQDLMVLGLRIAGFEVRETLCWVYASGFPKSHNVAKFIDKAAGVEREVVSRRSHSVNFEKEGVGGGGRSAGEVVESVPATEDAKRWNGWGSALKPSYEPITLARKPLTGTLVNNVLAYGTGGLNIDGCRVPGFAPGELERLRSRADAPRHDIRGGAMHAGTAGRTAMAPSGMSELGRWPSNFLHDGSEEVLDLLGDSARFFKCAKASKKDREDGLEDIEAVASGYREEEPEGGYNGNDLSERLHNSNKRKNNHPTVKPTELMRWLCRLVTPPGGLILDPFAGSGSTGKAAVLEGFRCVMVEQDSRYCELASRRVGKISSQGSNV